ncbi:hypothetical protein SCHPADRAFT_273434 [Schizopora paradoxa]|uniref:Uncharacterized protein n=1 Tax=Schizopora paradoxa TaxID=27342 RepID=A0A0H2RTD0_9AGAM|nr:hypothetical protein SCHPADRAFT_273434 [Schizopora paradoxa]
MPSFPASIYYGIVKELPSPPVGDLLNVASASRRPLLSHFDRGFPSALSFTSRFTVSSAGRRDSHPRGTALRTRREDISLAFLVFTPPNIYDKLSLTSLAPARIAPAKSYNLFPGLEELVDHALLACEIYTRPDLSDDSKGYYVDLAVYSQLARALQSIDRVWGSAVRHLAQQPDLRMPGWGLHDRPAEVWPALVFEIFAVRFRVPLQRLA